MNTFRRMCITLFIFTLFSAIVFAQEDRPIITVLDFKGSNIAEAELFVFVDYVTSLVVDSNLFRVIDRSQRETLLKEIEFSLSGCTDEACQLEIGRLLSAKFIIVGSLGTVGSRYLLNMKMIDIETSETIASASERYTSMDDLIDDSDRVVAVFVGVEGAEKQKKPSAVKTDDNVRRGEVEGKTVELVPSPIPRPVKQDYWKRQGLEMAFGYMDGPVVTGYGGYVYDVFRFLGLGAFAGFYIAEETYDNVFGYSYTDTVTDFLWGFKGYVGKRDGIAVSMGVVYLSDYSLTCIGLYVRNVFFDIAADPETDDVYFDVGYSMSF